MKTKSNLGNDLKYGTLIDRPLRPVGRLLNVKSKGVLRVCRPQLLQKVRELKLLWPLEVDDQKPPSMDDVNFDRKITYHLHIVYMLVLVDHIGFSTFPASTTLEKTEI